MAIHPIDLSTIYSQMDKIGQINASQVQNAHQANRENLERAANQDYMKNAAVQKAAKDKADSSKIKSDVSGSASTDAGGFSGGQRKENNQDEEESGPKIIEKFNDSGCHIDILG